MSSLLNWGIIVQIWYSSCIFIYIACLSLFWIQIFCSTLKLFSSNLENHPFLLAILMLAIPNISHHFTSGLQFRREWPIIKPIWLIIYIKINFKDWINRRPVVRKPQQTIQFNWMHRIKTWIHLIFKWIESNLELI